MEALSVRPVWGMAAIFTKIAPITIKSHWQNHIKPYLIDNEIIIPAYKKTIDHTRITQTALALGDLGDPWSHFGVKIGVIKMYFTIYSKS